MLCLGCGGKMRCRYSVPVGKQVRYRVYRCEACRNYLESVEVPERVAESPQLMGQAVVLMHKGRAKQIAFFVRRKRKAS